MSKIKKVISICKEYGFKRATGLIAGKVKSAYFFQKKRAVKSIKQSYKNHALPQLNINPIVSILVPVYNTDANMLKCVIESVISGTYKNIELCIYDASDEQHAYVGEICNAFGDSRITYCKGDNMSIADNTNKCAELAKGEYLALLDHDDILHRDAVYYVVKAIEEQQADFIYTDEVTFSKKITNVISTNFKPDYSPHSLRCNNYICHFVCFSKELFEKSGGFNSKYDGSQDHELFLRLTDMAENVYHIPKILYFWRAEQTSVALDINSKKYAIDAGINGVNDFLKSKGIKAKAESSEVYPTIYRIRYELENRPLVSMIIPNHEHLEDLTRLMDSLKGISYDNYEIVIVENNSTSEELKNYYKELQKSDKIKIIEYNHPFNYSEFNNIAVKEAAGEYLLFLNNDIKVINQDFLEEMMMYAIQKEVGAVGAKLFYPDNTLQHCFVITGAGEDRVAAHAGAGNAAEDLGYLDRIGFVQDANAVTAACMLLRKSSFEEVGGFDEKLTVSYNDVDLCLKLRAKGYYNIYTPYARLYHYESASRGSDWQKENRKRLVDEATYMKDKWKDNIRDPFYNINFSLDNLYKQL